MKARDGYRVLPWPDWVEWLEMKDLIDKHRVQEARQRVNTFTLRRAAAVPIAMLSTVSLMSQLDNPSPDSYTQRLGLSMVITRLVNGTTDRIQPRGERSVARSVASLAAELGMPMTLVDIRHQACHNDLPSLSWLTDAAHDALVWLKEWYWEPQLKNVWNSVRNSTYVLAKVFRDELSSTERELMTSDFVKENTPKARPSNPNDSAVILKQMEGFSNRLEQSIPEISEDEQEVAISTNSAEWKVTPFGLAFGQAWIPRRSLLPLKRIRRDAPSSEMVHDHGCDGIANDNSEDIGATNIETPLTDRAQFTQLAHFKRRKVLSTEEQVYFDKKVTEFQCLAEKIGAEITKGNQSSR